MKDDEFNNFFENRPDESDEVYNRRAAQELADQGKGTGAKSPVVSPEGKSRGAGTVEIEGVKLYLSHPDDVPLTWVGQSDLKLQLKAAWLVLDAKDYPLNPRLLGKPGVGKTTLAYSTARELGRDVFIFQATMDTRPEDLLISPVISSSSEIKYVASPLVTAMICGGVCILDEGNRMSEKSWASLAPLLDGRRYIESIVAGIKVKAHSDFRFVATMNDDASTFEIPEYINSRLQPQIFIDFPERDDELLILRENLPFMEQRIMEYVVDFLQRAHRKDERYTVRDGINIARYAGKLVKAKNLSIASAMDHAVVQILGTEALSYMKGKLV